MVRITQPYAALVKGVQTSTYFTFIPHTHLKYVTYSALLSEREKISGHFTREALSRFSFVHNNFSLGLIHCPDNHIALR